MKKYLLMGVILGLMFVLMGCGQLPNLNGETTGEGSIAGTITWEGALLSGPEDTEILVITINPEEIESPEDIDPVTRTVVTASTGTYLIENVPVGTYYVIAWKDVNGSGDLDFDDSGEPLDAVGYHGTVEGDVLVAVPVVITGDGLCTGVNITLEILSSLFTITGQVESLGLTEPSVGISAAEVTLYGEAGNEVGAMITESGGSFSFEIPQGNYYLQAEAPGCLNGLTYNFQVDSNEEKYVNMLTSTEADLFGHEDTSCGIVGGMVVDGIGNAVEGASVSVTPAVSTGDIGYLVNDGSNPPYFDYSLTVTTEEGVFAIRNVPPGLYTLTVSHPYISYPVITITVEANSLTSDGVVLDGNGVETVIFQDNYSKP